MLRSQKTSLQCWRCRRFYSEETAQFMSWKDPFSVSTPVGYRNASYKHLVRIQNRVGFVMNLAASTEDGRSSGHGLWSKQIDDVLLGYWKIGPAFVAATTLTRTFHNLRVRIFRIQAVDVFPWCAACLVELWFLLLISQGSDMSDIGSPKL